MDYDLVFSCGYDNSFRPLTRCRTSTTHLLRLLFFSLTLFVNTVDTLVELKDLIGETINTVE